MNKTQIAFAIMVLRLLRMILVHVTWTKLDGPPYGKVLDDSSDLVQRLNKLL